MTYGHSTAADAAIKAISGGLECFFQDQGIASDPVLTVETDRGCLDHLFLRRSAWAAYSTTGTCVGVFDTAREASAALGGRS